MTNRLLRCPSTIYIPNSTYKHGKLPIKIVLDVVTEKEESELIQFASQKLKKFKFDSNHFDNVITDYRECMSTTIPHQNKIMSIVSQLNENWMPFHILELSQKGFINYHVDHYSGENICGLSLVGDCVMHLQRSSLNSQLPKDIYLFLPQRSLYMYSGYIRHDYKHAILNKYDIELPPFFKVKNSSRLSILMRNPENLENPEKE